MKVAVEGCCHGDLDKIYASILYAQQVENIKVDLLICCGDFQALRTESDMHCLQVPNKYKEMKNFHDYFMGRKVAPIPTLFIGGNHEASNYLWELYYGGYAAKNIFFLGFSGIVRFGNSKHMIRVGGLSGTYKSNDYRLPYCEKLPYDSNDLRSIYHQREFEVYKMKHITSKIHVMVSHDWPNHIYRHGDVEQIYKQKSFWRAQDFDINSIGSPPCEELLHCLQPNYWFSAHFHCKFAAVVKHAKQDDEDEELEQFSNIPSTEKKQENVTKFLALDKCLPGRCFLQILDIEDEEVEDEDSEEEEYSFYFDEEWLAILKSMEQLFPIRNTRDKTTFPRLPQEQSTIATHGEWLRKQIGTSLKEYRVPEFSYSSLQQLLQLGSKSPSEYVLHDQTKYLKTKFKINVEQLLIPNKWMQRAPTTEKFDEEDEEEFQPKRSKFHPQNATNSRNNRKTKSNQSNSHTNPEEIDI